MGKRPTQCDHRRAEFRFASGILRTGNYDVEWSHGDFGYDAPPVAATCVGCKAAMSLGPSNDAPAEVQVEILAAEVGQNPVVWQRFMDMDIRIANDLRRIGARDGSVGLGALTPDAGHAELVPQPHWFRAEVENYWSGWLAREIATHDSNRETRDSDAWSWDIARPLSAQSIEIKAQYNAIGALCDAVKDSGATMTLYGVPVTEGELRAHADQSVDARIERIAEQAERAAIAGATAKRHADLSPGDAFMRRTDHMERLTPDEKRAVIGGPGSHRAPGWVPPVVDAMYPATAQDAAADALRAGPMRGATPDEIDAAVEAAPVLPPLTPDEERAEDAMITAECALVAGFDERVVDRELVGRCGLVRFDIDVGNEPEQGVEVIIEQSPGLPDDDASPDKLAACAGCEIPFGCGDGGCVQGNEAERKPMGAPLSPDAEFERLSGLPSIPSSVHDANGATRDQADE